MRKVLRDRNTRLQELRGRVFWGSHSSRYHDVLEWGKGLLLQDERQYKPRFLQAKTEREGRQNAVRTIDESGCESEQWNGFCILKGWLWEGWEKRRRPSLRRKDRVRELVTWRDVSMERCLELCRIMSAWRTATHTYCKCVAYVTD